MPMTIYLVILLLDNLAFWQRVGSVVANRCLKQTLAPVGGCSSSWARTCTTARRPGSHGKPWAVCKYGALVVELIWRWLVNCGAGSRWIAGILPALRQAATCLWFSFVKPCSGECGVEVCVPSLSASVALLAASREMGRTSNKTHMPHAAPAWNSVLFASIFIPTPCHVLSVPVVQVEFSGWHLLSRLAGFAGPVGHVDQAPFAESFTMGSHSRVHQLTTCHRLRQKRSIYPLTS